MLRAPKVPPAPRDIERGRRIAGPSARIVASVALATEANSIQERLRAVVALVVLLLAVFSVGTAQAAPGDAELDEGTEYARAIDAALEEYELSHFEEARSLFERAHAIDPNARTLRGLGMVEFELRHYLRAQALLEQALSSQRKPLTDEQRASVVALLARARQFIARFTLQLVPTPPSFALRVDGERVQLGADGVLSLTAGEHTLQIEGDSIEPRKLTLDARGGDQQTRRIELEPAAQQARARQPQWVAAHSPTRRETQRPHRALGILLVSAGAASLSAGALLGGLALSRTERSEQRGDSDAQTARSLALGADAALGVGIAAAIAGTICLLYRRDVRPAGSSRTESRLHAIFPTFELSF